MQLDEKKKPKQGISLEQKLWEAFQAGMSAASGGGVCVGYKHKFDDWFKRNYPKKSSA